MRVGGRVGDREGVRVGIRVGRRVGAATYQDMHTRAAIKTGLSGLAPYLL